MALPPEPLDAHSGQLPGQFAAGSPLLSAGAAAVCFALAIALLRVLLVRLGLVREEAEAEKAKGTAHASARQRTRSSGAGGPALDAATCWASEFGRFKYQGLRPNPLDPTEPPADYSLKPLDLPLPEMSTSQKEALLALQARVSDLSNDHRTDLGTLCRFLRARQYKADEAEKYFREAAQWREEHGVNQVFSHWNLQAYEECLAPWWLSGGFCGHGHRGEVIAYERMARCNLTQLVRRLPMEEIEKLDIVHCQRSLAACEEDCLRQGLPMGNGILVEDCDGFDFDQATLAAARAMGRLLQNRNFLLPECLTTVLVIRAPAAWVYAWRMFSYILDPGTRKKVQVAGRDKDESLAVLRKYIPNDQIPAYLGGGLHVEGDPECRKTLAPGGPMPEEARTRFLALVAHSQRSRVNKGQQREEPELAPKPGRGCCCCWGAAP